MLLYEGGTLWDSGYVPAERMGKALVLNPPWASTIDQPQSAKPLLNEDNQVIDSLCTHVSPLISHVLRGRKDV